MPRPYRMLHTADVHLERPPVGPVDSPDEYVDWLGDVPYQVFEAIVAKAVDEAVDAVVIAGDLVDLNRAGPRAVAFLLEQFSLLGEEGIAVVWAPGTAEVDWETNRDVWPENVLLPKRRPTLLRPQLGAHDPPLVFVYWPYGFESEANDRQVPVVPAGSLVVGVGHIDGDKTEPAELIDCVPDIAGSAYWALGGSHRRKTVNRNGVWWHDPGTPQGRDWCELGTHSVSIVEIGADGLLDAPRAITVETLQYRKTTLLIEAESTPETIVASAMREVEAATASTRIAACFAVEFAGGAADLAAARRSGLIDKALQKIAERCAQRKPSCRIGPVRFSVWDDPGAEFGDETLRGELLKMLAGGNGEDATEASEGESSSTENEAEKGVKIAFSSRDEAVVRALQALHID
ncbi:hypothetical protein JCM19992_23680 [Thermostilla marina]